LENLRRKKVINEYYILANSASIKPLVQVWLDGREQFLPLCVYGVKDHATIKVQNKVANSTIHDGQICRISPKLVDTSKVKRDQPRLI
jgi:hypothetical protein